LKTIMVSSRIHKVGQAKLPYIPKPLKPWMLDYIVDKIVWNTYKSVYRIVYYFSLVYPNNHKRDLFIAQKYE